MNNRPTPETDAYITSQSYSPTEHQWRCFARKLERERDEARAAAKLAYSILDKVNKQSLETAAWRAAIKHINNTPMDWLKSIVQNWKEGK